MICIACALLLYFLFPSLPSSSSFHIELLAKYLLVFLNGLGRPRASREASTTSLAYFILQFNHCKWPMGVSHIRTVRSQEQVASKLDVNREKSSPVANSRWSPRATYMAISTPAKKGISRERERERARHEKKNREGDECTRNGVAQFMEYEESFQQ